MSVLQVTRTHPQNLVAIQVSTANAMDIAELFAALVGHGYSTKSQTGADFANQGYWRLTVSRKEYPDQFAYPGEYILVSDATNIAGVWTVSASTEIVIYGQSSGQPSVADFTNTFSRGLKR